LERIRRVLVALDLDPRGADLTPGSRRAADQALWLAPHLAAPVTLFHSKAHQLRPEQGAGGPQELVRRLSPEAARVLEAVQAQFRGAGFTTDLVISEQQPWLGIVREVLRQGVDLVVAGKRNDPREDGRRLGSTSQRLLRECPCGVWVVKPGGVGVIERVLAATDLSPVGDQVVHWAAFVAERCRAELHVVHAIQLPFDVQWGGGDSEAEYERRQREGARRHVEALLEQAGYRGPCSWHMGITSPSRAVTRCVDGLHPDLVVMGTLSRGGIAGRVIGNTAERLLERLDCSLLTVKPSDFVCPVEADAPSG
jgi:universal stress protein E